VAKCCLRDRHQRARANSGTVCYPGFREVPAIWEDGALTQLPYDWGLSEGVRVLGINDRGDVVGTSIDYGAEIGILWTQ
jgi:hypothetical protein